MPYIGEGRDSNGNIIAITRDGGLATYDATGEQVASPDIVQQAYDTGFNDTIAQYISSGKAKELMDKSSGIPEGRRTTPPSYYEYTEYEHRADNDSVTLRIGDCQMIVPPDFIAVKEITNTESTVALRQRDSLKKQYGYSRKEITITAFFNGLNQINGYEVESPFDYKYHVDGLRPLLAQFKCTPFLPVENEFLNYTNDIFNIALQSITVNTVQGFPNVLQATIIAHEFNAVPYIEMPNYAMDDMIDWDLFRFYYQQFLRDNKDEKTLHKTENSLNSQIEFLLLDGGKLVGEKMDEEVKITDDMFYKHISNIGDDGDEFVVSEINFGLTNMLTFLQLSNHPSPTMQYLGGSDTIVNFTIETLDRDVAAKFTQMSNYTKSVIRENRQYDGLGFVKINNEILKIIGSHYIMINSCVVTTVPDFPGKYNIAIECVSYDMRAKDRELVNGFKPFSGGADGTDGDAISQTPGGAKNKIRQDIEAERRIMDMELYPDLYLPTYKEVDDAVSRISGYRAKTGIASYHLTDKYPRRTPLYNLGGEDSVYEMFVDPDFYMCYPFDYGSIDDSSAEMVELSKPKPDAVDITINYAGTATSGSSPGSGVDFGSLSSYSNYSAGRQAFLRVLFGEVGQGYAMGANGQVLTQAEANRLISTYGALPGITKWIGKKVYDCSGFILWGMYKIGLNSTVVRTDHSSLIKQYCTKINQSELKPGDLASNGNHIVVYIGDGKTVEAASTESGVKYGTMGNRFYTFARINGIDSLAGSTSTTTTSDNGASMQGGHEGSQARITNDYIEIGKFGNTTFDQYDTLIDKYARKWGLNPNYMKALMRQESAMDASCTNSVPAYGLMQITKYVWMHFKKPVSSAEGFNAETNIDMGFGFAKSYLDKYNGNYEYMVQAYNCGDVRFDSYLKGTRGLPEETRNHVIKIKGFYATLIKNGGKEASYTADGGITGSALSGETWASTGTSGFSVTKKHGDRSGEFTGNWGTPMYLASPLNYLYDENNNIVKSEDETVSLVDPLIDYAIETYNLLAYESTHSRMYNDAVKTFHDEKNDKALEMMTVDMASYGNKGSLLRAFPTYAFLIVDENSDWLDGKKLWNNYYNYKSVVDIAVHDEKSQPVKTATITVTNMNNKLQKTAKEDYYRGDVTTDPEYKFTGWLYKNTGLFLGTLKVTEKAIEVKNTVVKSMKLEAGARIHIRMGYGSNPSMLPVVFNGTVTDMSAGNVISMVAQSDGTELINNIISTKKEEKNGLTNLQSEASNIIAAMLTDKDNYLLNSLNSAWGERSKYGIEHFGTSVIPQLNILDSKFKEYDICKNVYVGKYKQMLYCADDAMFGADGETNINMYLYNKTPWDVMQILAQKTPEFVCQPMYHQFDTRLFFGLPYWPAKYRYDYDEGEDKYYEYAKSFAQLHFIDSVGDIIDNQIMCSTRNMYTNCIAMYTEGSDMHSTPVLYSDKNIMWSSQKTKIVDTTTVQDLPGVDFLYKIMGITPGKETAINIGISNIIDGMEQMYEGEIIMIGDPSIKSCDYAMIDDIAGDMAGIVGVRSVVHRFGMDGGLTTSITPGLVSYSKMKDAGTTNLMSSLFFVGMMVGSTKLLRWGSIKAGAKLGSVAAAAKELKETAVMTDVYKNIKNAKIVKDGANVATKATDSLKATAAAKKVKSGLTSAKSIVTAAKVLKGNPVAAGIVAGLPGLVAWFACTIIANSLLEATIDYFSYNNCVGIRPVVHKSRYFVTGTRGQKSLIDGTNNGTEDNILEEDLEEAIGIEAKTTA